MSPSVWTARARASTAGRPRSRARRPGPAPAKASFCASFSRSTTAPRIDRDRRMYRWFSTSTRLPSAFSGARVMSFLRICRPRGSTSSCADDLYLAGDRSAKARPNRRVTSVVASASRQLRRTAASASRRKSAAVRRPGAGSAARFATAILSTAWDTNHLHEFTLAPFCRADLYVSFPKPGFSLMAKGRRPVNGAAPAGKEVTSLQ